MANNKKCILVVDDSPTNARLLGEMLRTEYIVRIASSGSIALEMCAAGPLPDLILLDVVMPHPDGFEVCRRLKSDERTASIPVVFISASDTETDRACGMTVGATEFLSKPFNPTAVQAIVRRLTHG